MDYLPYVIAAYTVFAVILLADFIAGHLAVRRALRQPLATRTRRQPAAQAMQELER